MIEIVKYGKQFATCKNCGAVLKFDQADIKTAVLKFDQTDIKAADSEYIVCPVCKYQIGSGWWNKDIGVFRTTDRVALSKNLTEKDYSDSINGWNIN